MGAREDMHAQIKQAVTAHPVVLFMKGTPVFPQCGFSARTVQILETYGKEIKAVDVLANPLVRESIKEYSDWPTVPQLYVNGEFVGGCDIVVEMHENGELAEILRGVPDAAALQT